ncbi:hypothetical protein Zmor_014849 [Zophobas morio]|uniref:Tc1-like transposase DDE domain-containing protein n=1 Tax=Zophobas morio TaxID=2755281 RepID=A0AA38IIW0_9CUCU|nr:hypothetical protein Zmor_014849 [Zophobas morio]
MRGNLNARGYIDTVLKTITVPYLRGLDRPLFQQDNARPHTARVTTEYLQQHNVEVLPWSARSPDLSPIEHVWNIMSTRLGNLQHSANNLNDLCTRLQKPSDEIAQDTINHLLSSKPRRVNECIRNHGGSTHY